MKGIQATLAAGMLLLAALGAGCGDEPVELGAVSLGELFAPSPEDKVSMLYDDRHPDRVRRGLNLVSAEPWGLEEPYLAKYAEIAQTDPEPACRGAAVRALGRAGDTTYLDVLIDAMDDAAASVRWDAAVALGETTGPEAVAPMSRHAIDDDSTDVRAACAKSLRHYAGAAVRDTLVDCLMDEAFAVRYQARQSLVELTGRDAGYDPHAWRDVASRSPRTRPAARRPWWDWAGLTERDADAVGEGPEPATRPAEVRDLTDVLDADRDAADAPAPDTTSGGASEGDRPWWDWMGVTGDDTPSDEAGQAP